jgi:bifunctional non-homologous end joining protein LigD
MNLMNLSRYHAKRDFSRTREPKGRSGRVPRAAAGGQFVIQKHAASRLHYDFRLEISGVLKSWAVPKGIPTEKGDKRLAIAVEDHPVEYGSFEGIIPPGSYGAGTVMLWDTGAFESLEDTPAAAVRKGKLVLHLAGGKLNGHWTLVRMKPGQFGRENSWLLIKTEETVRSISARADDCSAVSGRTMKQIAAGSKRPTRKRAPSSQAVFSGASAGG